jgi:gamma-glutamyltranspeptidase / glutathione hydrolase
MWPRGWKTRRLFWMLERPVNTLRLTLLLLTVVTVTLDLDAQGEPEKSGLPVPGRSVVSSTYGVVAASHPLAAAAGVQALQQGGTAVDAALAASAAIAVMEPTGNGLGSDLFALIYEAKDGRVHGLNASGWAPRQLTRELMSEQGFETMPERHVHTVTVPGVVAGWEAMRARFGRLDYDRLLAPAIHYAEEGFPVSEITAWLWSRSVKMLSARPEAARTFLIDGRAPRAGEVFRNPGLARTLGLIARDGSAAYYRGPIADAIVRSLREQGGVMEAADLAEFEAEWVEPLRTEYRDWTVYQIPPNTQGIATLVMLNIMERFPLSEWGFHDPRALHAMIEAKKLAYADMLRYVGDPRLASVPVEAMLSKEHAAHRAQLVDPEKAACEVQPAELPGVTSGPAGDTIYLSAVDRDGNVVSLIQSNYMGFGSGIVPEGTGFMLHNRGALFTLEPGHANILAPRKRPLHTIIPGMMARGPVHIGFGIMGGWNQAQAHAQFVSHIADHGMTIQQALEAGRFTKPTFEGCDVNVEELVPEAPRATLVQLGHEVQTVGRRSSTFGYGQATMTENGVQSGASDPRHDGAAIPEPAPVLRPR